MIKNNFPNNIAIFPLSNAIFFPKTLLPLNIFEKRYLQLVSDCMKNERIFGMIQPKTRSNLMPEVYSVGCLGKIVNFNETNDKRFIINLSGIMRFRIKKELDSNKLYRKFEVDYSDFIGDLELQKNDKNNYAEKNLLKRVKFFFERINYSIEFNELEKLNFDQLINTICMISPFSPEEKQKLIETVKIEERLKVLEKIINFNILDVQKNKTIQ